jgi:hypothetical protein
MYQVDGNIVVLDSSSNNVWDSSPNVGDSLSFDANGVFSLNQGGTPTWSKTSDPNAYLQIGNDGVVYLRSSTQTYWTSVY